MVALDRDMRRRDFILGSLVSAVFVACGDDETRDAAQEAIAGIAPTSPAEQSHRAFPQGVASGDPRPDRVVLWTRVEPIAVDLDPARDVTVAFVIARDEALTDVVARGRAVAAVSADHTVRLIPTELAPGTRYFYRFAVVRPGGAETTTQVGRTRTAPDPAADVPVKFAIASCQDFIGRYWHSWRALLEEGVDLDFVLFLGDYIYETVNDPRFQSTTPDRAIQLPDGIDTSKAQDRSRIAAGTLADYRKLYRTYRSDPSLREVHRLHPFVLTWDDHEFADDCWQDHSTSFDERDPVTKDFTSERNTKRRETANRAFFEYQPADVVYDPTRSFPFDLRIYRQLRWGRHVDVFMTDLRSYRSDHLVPEGPIDLLVGKPLPSSLLGSRYFVRKAGFDPREAIARPTLLGREQKAWLVEAMKRSTATWKVWGNEVQMAELALELGRLPGIPDVINYTVYVNADAWDGYRSERREILGELRRAEVENLLVCTGDIHSFHAAELHVDFSRPSANPIGVEYVTAAISSASLKELIDKTVPPGSFLRPLVDAWTSGVDVALKATNPHLRFTDTNAYGFTLIALDGTKAEATFVELGNPTDKTYRGVLGRRRFVTRVGTNKVEPV